MIRSITLIGVVIGMAIATRASDQERQVFYEETRAALASKYVQVRLDGIMRLLKVFEEFMRGAPRTRDEARGVAGEFLSPVGGEIIRASKDESEGVRAIVACYLLPWFEASDDVIDAAVNLIGDENGDVRKGALGIAENLGSQDGRVRAAVLKLLDPQQPLKFSDGAAMVSKWRIPEAVPLLVAGVETDEVRVIKDAASALAAYDDLAKEAIGALKRARARLEASGKRQERGAADAVGKAIQVIEK